MFINSIFLPKTSSEQISSESNPLKFEGFSTLFSDLFKVNFENPDKETLKKTESSDLDETQNNAISFVNISVFANKNIQSVNKNISDIISEVLIGPGNNLLTPEDSIQTKGENTPVKSAKIFAVSKDEFINEIRNVLKNLQLKSDSSSGNTTLTIEANDKVININTTLNNLSNINDLLQENMEGSETFKLLFESDKKEISVEVTPVTIKSNTSAIAKNLKEVLSDSINKSDVTSKELNIEKNGTDIKNIIENPERKTKSETKTVSQTDGSKIKITHQKPTLNLENTAQREIIDDREITSSLKQTNTNQSPAKNLSSKSEILNDLFQKTEIKEIIIGTNKNLKVNNIKQSVDSQNLNELAEQKTDSPKIKPSVIQNADTEKLNPEFIMKPVLKVISEKEKIQQEIFKPVESETKSEIDPETKYKSALKVKPNDISKETQKVLTKTEFELQDTKVNKILTKPDISKELKNSTGDNILKDVSSTIKSQQTNKVVNPSSATVEFTDSEIDKSPEIKLSTKPKVNIEEKFVKIQNDVVKGDKIFEKEKTSGNPLNNKETKTQTETINQKVISNPETGEENEILIHPKDEKKTFVQENDQQNLEKVSSEVSIKKPGRISNPLNNQKEIQPEENVQISKTQTESDYTTEKPSKNFHVVEIVSEEEMKLHNPNVDNKKIETPKSSTIEELTDVPKSDQLNPKSEKQVWVKVVVEERETGQKKVIENVRQETKPAKSEMIDNNKNDSLQNQLKDSHDTPKEDQLPTAKSKTDFNSEIKQEFQKQPVENNNHQNVKTEIPAGTVQLKQLIVEDKKPINKSSQVIERTKVLSANELLKEVYKVFETGEKQTVVLKLTPKELGAIKIILDTVDNTLNAKVEVNNESVGHLMKSNVESLKQNLLQNGVQLNSINISFTNSDQKQSGLNHQKRRNQNLRFENDIEFNEETILPKRMGYNTYEFLA